MSQIAYSMRELFELMEEKGASDLHLTTGIQPYFRIDGKILPTGLAPLSEQECESMVFTLLNEEQVKIFQRDKVLDCSHGEREFGRFRVNIYRQRGTVTAAIRRLPHRIPDLDELGLPVDLIKSLCDRPGGLLIVAGPVGSGKTTTLAAMAKYINHTRNCHILSFEDPIEYIHENAKSLIHQREIHTDTESFANALKYGLREDPDVLLVGEMRDLETIASAITIAETGHLVLATLHTASSGESISRMVDVFSAIQQSQVRLQLSCSLVGVVNQMLLPEIGEKGRVLATEILVTTPAIASLIRDNKVESIYSHIQIGGRYGMRTMNQALYQLVMDKKISRAVAMSKSSRPGELEKLLDEI